MTTPKGQTVTATHATFDPSVKKTACLGFELRLSAGIVTLPGIAPKITKATAAAPRRRHSYTYKVNIEATGQDLGGRPGRLLPAGRLQRRRVREPGRPERDHLRAEYANANDTTGKYSFDADVDRNGIITQKDLTLAKKNLGVGTTVSPVISANLDPASVTDAKNRVTSNTTVHITGAATPGAS